MLEFYDLNARHTATIIWGTLLIFYAFFSSGEVRRSFLRVLRAILNPSMALVIIGLICNVSIIVALWTGVGRHFGFWETIPLVTSSFWVAMTGFSLLALLSEIIQRDKALRNRVMSTVAPATILAGVLGFAILPFWCELIMTPTVSLVAIAWHRQERIGKSQVPKITLLICVAGLISWAMVDLVRHPIHVISLIQGILLPVVLMLGTVPYIQILVMSEKFQFSARTKSKRVASVGYGSNWPLSTSSAKLCRNSGAVWVEANGSKYCLNGLAQTLLTARGYDWRDLNEIWLDQIHETDRHTSLTTAEEPNQLKVNIWPLLYDGLDLEGKP